MEPATQTRAMRTPAKGVIRREFEDREPHIYVPIWIFGKHSPFDAPAIESFDVSEEISRRLYVPIMQMRNVLELLDWIEKV